MPSRTLLSGPNFSVLEARAFNEVSDTAGTHPESILYLTQNDHPRQATENRWKEFGPSASLRIESFDDFVITCYEREHFKGRVTHIDRPLLFRLVELGLEKLESEDNPLHTNDEFPRFGLVEEAEALYTELEFAGLLSPEEMQSRLEAEGLPSQAEYLRQFAASIESVRDSLLADQLPETYRTERMDYVVGSETPLSNLLPSVDAVVLGGFTRFDALERDLLQRIAEEWPTFALLPQQVDSDETVGVDSGVKRALETYRDLGFARTFCVDTNSKAEKVRRRVTQNLYRHPTQTPSIDDFDATELELDYTVSPTPSEEIRETAKTVRTRLSTGIEPDDIGIVLLSPSEYSEQVRETFERYNFPFVMETETPLTETALGSLVETVCHLSREPRSVDTLLELFTNPLVEIPDQTGTPLDYLELSRVAGRIETNSLKTALTHLEEESASEIRSLVNEISDLATIPLGSLSDELDSLFDRWGASDALNGDRNLSHRFLARESSAQERLDRILDTLALTEPLANIERGDNIDRLERALSGVSVQSNGLAPENSVVVCSLSEAIYRDFESVFVLGMTSSHFPSTPNRSAFVRPIYESHPDFEQRDITAEARSHFAALLASEAEIQLSAPERSIDGEPFVEADILTELRRLFDLTALKSRAGDTAPGCPEDIQRTLASVHEECATATVQELLSEATTSGAFSEKQRSRIESGIACASARSTPGISPYDGLLSAEIVSQVHQQTDREPFSPSRLESYAACGFKYYLRRVLDIEAPDPLTREPGASDRGTYIHDVLEHYYRSLQSRDGEPVHPGGDFDSRQERMLTVAFDRLDDTFDGSSKTAFHDEWLTTVLAGLGSPEENEYYGPVEETPDGRPVARGLFYRFLEHEFDEPAKTTARPSWFEARIGNPYDAGTPISDEPTIVETPSGPVPVHGLIDRVDTVPGTEPTQAVVRDYKTGTSIPSADDALLGLNFQLPLYSLMAEDALDDVETVGAAYYQASPPASVNSRSGLFTSQEMAVYHGSDDVQTPLLRHSYPHFESHEGFRKFVEDRTPDRLGQLGAGIEEGLFHPTILDPSDAGCRYCDYSHVCDVRSHKRRETIDEIDDTDVPAYVPPIARGVEPEDVVEVN